MPASSVPAAAARSAGSVDPAHDRGDPGQQLLASERLDQVVVGADLQGPNLGTFAALAGHDQDRHVAGGPDLAGHAEAVRAGHRQVEQDQVGRLLAEPAHRRQPVVGGDHLVAVLADEGGDRADHGRVVVDDEDAERTDVGHRLASSDGHGRGQGKDEPGTVARGRLTP